MITRDELLESFLECSALLELCHLSGCTCESVFCSDVARAVISAKKLKAKIDFTP